MPHTNAATTIRMPKSTLPRIILVSAIEIAAIPSAMYQELIGIYHLSGGVQHHFCTWYSVTPVIRTLAFAFRTTTELSLQKWCWTPLGLSLPNRCGLRSLPRRELCPPSGLRWWDANTARCMPRTNASHSTTLGITKSRSGAGYTFAMRSIWCVGSLGQQASPLEVVSTTCSHVLRPVDFQRISNGFSRLLLA